MVFLSQCTTFYIKILWCIGQLQCLKEEFSSTQVIYFVQIKVVPWRYTTKMTRFSLKQIQIKYFLHSIQYYNTVQSHYKIPISKKCYLSNKNNILCCLDYPQLQNLQLSAQLVKQRKIGRGSDHCHIRKHPLLPSCTNTCVLMSFVHAQKRHAAITMLHV